MPNGQERRGDAGVLNSVLRTTQACIWRPTAAHHKVADDSPYSSETRSLLIAANFSSDGAGSNSIPRQDQRLGPYFLGRALAEPAVAEHGVQLLEGVGVAAFGRAEHHHAETSGRRR